MLYLYPPFHFIDGVSIYPDHEDKLQYYYLPATPRIAKESGRPQIKMICFKGGIEGGFLTLDVNLGIDEEKKKSICNKLRVAANLKDNPKLSPILFVDGSVEIMLFGVKTENSQSEGKKGIKFVKNIVHSDKPALYGDNRAIFSVSLDKDGIIILKEAIKNNKFTTIGIVYSLDYLALRPAYSVKLTVDWEVVKRSMDEKFSTDLLFFSMDIDEAVDELIEKKIIKIDSDTSGTEEEDPGIIDRKDRAINEIKDMVTKAFFKPSLDPQKKEVYSWDNASDPLYRSIMISDNGPGCLFSYHKTEMTQINKMILNANISERTTIRRSIYPQGHLSCLLEGFDFKDFLVRVDLDNPEDPWFKKRKVEISSNASFEKDQINFIVVKLTYGNEPQEYILDFKKSKKTAEWPCIIDSNSMKREVKVSYDVYFKNRPEVLHSNEKVIKNDFYVINPSELYKIFQIPIVDIAVPWDEYPAVTVQTQYFDEQNNIKAEDKFHLKKGQNTQTWDLFNLDPKIKTFKYRVIYFASSGCEYDKGWVDSTLDNSQISLYGPYQRKRDLRVTSYNINWTEVNCVDVYLSFEDGIKNCIEKELTFSKDTQKIQNFTFPIVDNDEECLVKYNVILKLKNKNIVQIPESTTKDTSLSLSGDMQGHKIIKVYLHNTDIASKKLKEIDVTMRYEESKSETFTFNSENYNAAYFSFDYVDAKKSAYIYKVKYCYKNGRVYETKPKSSADQELAIPLI